MEKFFNTILFGFNGTNKELQGASPIIVIVIIVLGITGTMIYCLLS